MNIRVADIRAAYDEWRVKGAEFLTEPIDGKTELRCYMRDPDGYLIEVGQATGMLEASCGVPRGIVMTQVPVALRSREDDG